MIHLNIYESEEVCANCRHYHQHYTESPGEYGLRGFMPVNAGHCVTPRVKDRRPGDTCENFEQRER